jgi:hypothetical protein
VQAMALGPRSCGRRPRRSQRAATPGSGSAIRPAAAWRDAVGVHGWTPVLWHEEAAAQGMAQAAAAAARTEGVRGVRVPSDGSLPIYMGWRLFAAVRSDQTVRVGPS